MQNCDVAAATSLPSGGGSANVQSNMEAAPTGECLVMENDACSGGSGGGDHGDHDYDEPVESEDILSPVRKHGHYDIPRSIPREDWKRLSLPSLEKAVTLQHLRRSTSSITERLSSGITTTTNTNNNDDRKSSKPFRIPHYAEFSLCPPSQQKSSRKASENEEKKSDYKSLISLRSTGIHEYDRPTYSGRIIPPDLFHHVPAPQLLRRASEYEKPMASPKIQRARSSLSAVVTIRTAYQSHVPTPSGPVSTPSGPVDTDVFDESTSREVSRLEDDNTRSSVEMSSDYSDDEVYHDHLQEVSLYNLCIIIIILYVLYIVISVLL